MTQYHDYIIDLPGRCLDIFEYFEPEAKKQDKEVTLLLMAATSAFVIPLERIKSKELYSDSKEVFPSFDEELKKKWSESPLSRCPEEWPLGFTEDWDGGPNSWPPPTTGVGNEDVSEVLRIIRNALAHGNLHTDGNLADGNYIHLLRLHSEEHHEYYWNKVIGYKYLDIPVSDFRQFLFNWLALLDKFNIQPKTQAGI